MCLQSSTYFLLVTYREPHGSGIDSAPRDCELLGAKPAEMGVYHAVHIHTTGLQDIRIFDQGFGSAAACFFWCTEHKFCYCSLIVLYKQTYQ